MKEQVNTALKAHFRPEFLNRIDDVIVFHELAKEEVIEIAEMLLTRTKDQLALQGIGLELTPGARQLHRREGLRPAARRAAAAPRDPVDGRGPALREAPVEGVPLGETILVDVDPDGDDGLAFSAIEGFVPPTVELAGLAPGAD